jgi:hypothetical protein
MTDCCMDIEKNDTSLVAAMLLRDDLHNYSKIANLASLLEGGGPNMAKAMESYLNFVDPRVVSFASFALPNSAVYVQNSGSSSRGNWCGIVQRDHTRIYNAI